MLVYLFISHTFVIQHFGRRLAEVSRLTRGVVVLICDIHYAKLVMDEAKRLNMLEGHFFWIWIDASSEFDVFHNISNRTNNIEDTDQEFEKFRNKKEAFVGDDDFERRKRNDADNNSIQSGETPSIKEDFSQIANDVIIRKNNSYFRSSEKKTFFRRVIRNTNKYETHISNKLLYINFSQSYNGSQNISEESVRNYNVNKKGVETSKIENNSIEKEKKSFLDRNKSRQTSSSKLKNESFNKYVNSINVKELYETKDNILSDEKIVSSIDSTDLRDTLLFSSDISDFIMNPTVHTSTVSNVDDRKKDDNDYMELDDEPIKKVNNNITAIFNSLPIGLLALHPQPMKIGKYFQHFIIINFVKIKLLKLQYFFNTIHNNVDEVFARAAVEMMVGALRRVLRACDAWSAQAQFFSDAAASCWDEPSDAASDFSMEFVRYML